MIRLGKGEMRILLVEDEPSAAAMLAKGLREEAYAVDMAADGESALAQAFVNDYDLIILDVVLPGKDGFTVCRELRSNDLTAPVLMLTARDAVEDRVEGLDSGADDYLPKPFDFDELLARVRALLRRKPALYPEVITVDRKSTRLNSSHGYISYAVFCLKKKKRSGSRRARAGRWRWSAGS